MYSPEYTELHRPRSFTTHPYLGSHLPFSDVRVAPPILGGQFARKTGVVCSSISCYPMLECICVLNQILTILFQVSFEDA